jgi:glucose/arabinose dehydrogenase
MIRSTARRQTLCLIAVLAAGALVDPQPGSGQANSISGQVRYYGTGQPVAGVTVQLQGPTPSAMQTDATGQFAFSGLAQGTWNIEPQKLGDVNGAISTGDAVGALQAVVGLYTPTEPQQLACDVSGGGNLTPLDAVLILQKQVGLISQFPEACGDWVFMPVPAAAANQQVTQPQVEPSSCQPGAIAFQPLAGAAVDQDFLAVLLGDCNGNWIAPPTPTRTSTPPVTSTPTPTPTIKWPQIALGTTISGFNQPVHIANAGDGSGRLFVVEQGGYIRLIKNGTLQSTPFLDIHTKVSCCGERGLLSVAFPSGYASKQHFYVDYTDTSGNTVVARYRLVANNPDQADPNSEEVVLTVIQPYANHNGGLVVFNPADGFMYIGMGDGGSGGDPENRAQDVTTLLGKLLRIDVEAPTPTGTPTPYAIPVSNPTIPTPGARREIWAYGLRNPWRFSFDRLTGDLYIGDVGQNTYEEIDFQPASDTGGENYGWRIMEGFHCYNPNPCSSAGLTLPVIEYAHGTGDCAVTGGLVYRGTTYPCMHGVYFYADYCSGRIWGAKHTGAAFPNTLLYSAPFSITSFGDDEAGNLWITDYTNGAIAKLTDACVGPTLTPTPSPAP